MQNIFLHKIMFFYVKNIYNALKINKILRGPVWNVETRLIASLPRIGETETRLIASLRLKNIIRRLKSLRRSCQSDFFVRKRSA